MQFEWDPEKAVRVFAERGLAFQDIAQLFDAPHIIVSSDQKGEQRWRIVGEVAGRCVTGIYTQRGDSVRIITARRSWKNEQRNYRSIYP